MAKWCYKDQLKWNKKQKEVRKVETKRRGEFSDKCGHASRGSSRKINVFQDGNYLSVKRGFMRKIQWGVRRPKGVGS